jgi:hypothetical protein
VSDNDAEKLLPAWLAEITALSRPSSPGQDAHWRAWPVATATG